VSVLAAAAVTLTQLTTMLLKDAVLTYKCSKGAG
jgi:hypothetical protein